MTKKINYYKLNKISLASGNRVRRVSTPISESQMISAISSCWSKLFGGAPTREQVSMVMAQNDLETGNRKAMYNYNVGNITTYEGQGYDYFDDLTTSEQIKPGVWEKKNLKFRAYNSLEDGVTDYLKFLSGSSRYAKAWQHIKNPDPEKYSKELKAAGYYTADESRYTKTLVQLFNKNKSRYDQASKSKGETVATSQEQSQDPVALFLKLLTEEINRIFKSFT